MFRVDPNAAIPKFDIATLATAYIVDRRTARIGAAISLISAMLSSPRSPPPMPVQCFGAGRDAAWEPLDMVKLTSVLLVLGAATAVGGAEASSLIFLDASDGSIGPSVIVLGDTTPSSTETAGATGTVSIIAVGEAPPAVSQEKLSSIAGDAPGRQGTTPMMIRGGIVEDALSQKPAAAAAEPRDTEKAPAPAPSGQDVGPSASSDVGPH